MKQQGRFSVSFVIMLAMLSSCIIWAMYSYSARVRQEYQPPIDVCLANVEGVQKAIRGFQSINDLKIGDPITCDELIQAGFLGEKPTCPKSHSYTSLDTIPRRGKAFLNCSRPSHNPKDTNNW